MTFQLMAKISELEKRIIALEAEIQALKEPKRETLTLKGPKAA